jgi:hypothetical protein
MEIKLMERKYWNRRLNNFLHVCHGFYVHSKVQWENLRRFAWHDQGKTYNLSPMNKKAKGTMTILNLGSRQLSSHNTPFFNISWHHINQSSWFLIS